MTRRVRRISGGGARLPVPVTESPVNGVIRRGGGGRDSNSRPGYVTGGSRVMCGFNHPGDSQVWTPHPTKVGWSGSDQERRFSVCFLHNTSGSVVVSIPWPDKHWICSGLGQTLDWTLFCLWTVTRICPRTHHSWMHPWISCQIHPGNLPLNPPWTLFLPSLDPPWTLSKILPSTLPWTLQGPSLNLPWRLTWALS